MFSSPLLPFILTCRARACARVRCGGRTNAEGWEATCLPTFRVTVLLSGRNSPRTRLVLQQQQRLSEKGGSRLCGFVFSRERRHYSAQEFWVGVRLNAPLYDMYRAQTSAHAREVFYVLRQSGRKPFAWASCCTESFL